MALAPGPCLLLPPEVTATGQEAENAEAAAIRQQKFDQHRVDWHASPTIPPGFPGGNPAARRRREEQPDGSWRPIARSQREPARIASPGRKTVPAGRTTKKSPATKGGAFVQQRPGARVARTARAERRALRAARPNGMKRIATALPFGQWIGPAAEPSAACATACAGWACAAAALRKNWFS